MKFGIDLGHGINPDRGAVGSIAEETIINAGGGAGTEVFTYNAKEVPLARAVLNNVCSLGFKNRGIKDGSHLAIVKRPKSTAMLIEVCFVDSNDSYKCY